MQKCFLNNQSKNKIKSNVREYFVFIKGKFSELDDAELDVSEIISLQILRFLCCGNYIQILNLISNLQIL